MAERILETYLNEGLLELNGQDAWFDHITTTADQLAKYIAENPAQLTGFIYSAIDSSNREHDPARTKVLEILKGIWRTYASVSMGSLETVQKGIILDAILQNAERDPQIKLTVTLLLSSTLPHIDLGSEAKVLQPILDQLINDTEGAAELNWSVPSSILLPNIPRIDAPTLNVELKKIDFDVAKLKVGLERATGPQNKEGIATEGNPQWPNQNQGQNWGLEFAPRAAESISEAIKDVASTRRMALKTDKLVKVIGETVEVYMKQIAQQLTAASHGVELRSRLLWWKEAKISPTTRIEYNALPPIVASALMAFDFQEMLPALAPASVIAFLRETVRTLDSEKDKVTLAELVTELSNSEILMPFQQDMVSVKAEMGMYSLSDLILAGVSDSKDINKMTLFCDKKELSLPEISTLLFTELQAKKAAAKIKATTHVYSDETDEEQESTEADI